MQRGSGVLFCVFASLSCKFFEHKAVYVIRDSLLVVHLFFCTFIRLYFYSTVARYYCYDIHREIDNGSLPQRMLQCSLPLGIVILFYRLTAKLVHGESQASMPVIGSAFTCKAPRLRLPESIFALNLCQNLHDNIESKSRINLFKLTQQVAEMKIPDDW